MPGDEPADLRLPSRAVTPGSGSDVDVLVDLDPADGNVLLQVAGIGEELAAILGVRVDDLTGTDRIGPDCGGLRRASTWQHDGPRRGRRWVGAAMLATRAGLGEWSRTESAEVESAARSTRRATTCESTTALAVLIGGVG